VTLLAGGKRIPLPAVGLKAETWTPVAVPLGGNEAANGIEFALGEPGRKGRLFAAGAVFNVTRAATLADLALVPGGLRPLPVAITSRDDARDYVALTRQLAAANPGFAKLDRVLVAVPRSSLAAARKVFTGMARFLDLPPLEADDQRIVPFDSADSLEAAFDAALIGRSHLLVVLVDTREAPRTSAAVQVKRCQDAMGKGTLPLLLLSHHHEGDPQLRLAWRSYLDALRRDLPTLPVIDGGAAARVLRENNATPGKDDGDRLRDESIAGGFSELVARLRAVLTVSGAGR
jgi:hypothetical protein